MLHTKVTLVSEKTCKAVERLYWWLTIHDDVQAFRQTCHSCRIKHYAEFEGLLQSLSVRHRKWGSVSVNLITAVLRLKRITLLL